MMVPPPPPPPPPAITVPVRADDLNVAHPSVSSTQVDQIGSDVAGDPRATITPAGTPDRSLAVSQVPSNRRPLQAGATTGTGDPAQIAKAKTPDLPEVVLQAWNAIQARGVAPTAELLTSELGPDTINQLFGGTGLPPSVISDLHAASAGTTPTSTPTGK
jgi:hypothetical protein